MRSSRSGRTDRDMPEILIKDKKNQDAGKMTLSDERFGLLEKMPLIHGSVVNFLANQRQGTHATKTKGLVSGGGKKPWKQKGTGRARSGSSRSPLWPGGGTCFGPQPRDYSYAMPRKQRKQALYASLSARLNAGDMVVVDSLAIDAPKTKLMTDILSGLGFASGISTLLIVDKADNNLLLATRNIPSLTVRAAADLHAYDVMSPRRVLATRAALELLEGGTQA